MDICGPKEGRWVRLGLLSAFESLLAGGVLGNSLGSLRHGVLGELSWKDQSNSGLNFAGRDGRSLVVVSKTRCLGGDAFEDIIDERVHDRHGL